MKEYREEIQHTNKNRGIEGNVRQRERGHCPSAIAIEDARVHIWSPNLPMRKRREIDKHSVVVVGVHR